MGWKLAALAKATGARVQGGSVVPEMHIAAISTDSRTLPGDALFVALRGDNFDGHTFVDAAMAAGAKAVLVEQDAAASIPARPYGPQVPQLVVADTLRAMGDMAAWVRQQTSRPLAAVTGSNGKTTTKELLAAALGGSRPVHKNQGNLNNLIGVPLTLFNWPDTAWAAVVEMGMSSFGEIARLTEIARPNVGVVTCVAAAHLGGLGSLANIAQAKSELYAGLPADAVAVLNADDGPLCQAAEPHLGKRQVLRFGRAEQCDVRLLDCQPEPGGISVVLRLDGQQVRFALPLLGKHNGMNAAAAAAVAWSMGTSVADIAAHMPQVKVPGARLRLRHAAHPSLTIIDDTYNANPNSMQAAFAALADVAGNKRRLAALGDMLELGPDAAALHRAVGRQAATSGVSQVFAFGAHAQSTTTGAEEAGAQAHAFTDVNQLCAALSTALRKDDCLLVKGSRGMRMERVVEHVLGGQA